MATGGSDQAGFVRALCNYPRQRSRLQDFLENFALAASPAPGKSKTRKGKSVETVQEKKYFDRVKCLGPLDVLTISGDDAVEFFNDGDKSADVVETLFKNSKRGLRLIYETVEIIRKEGNVGNAVITPETIHEKVRARIEGASHIPAIFRAPYEIHLTPPSGNPIIPIHCLRSGHVGSLLRIQGIVSRVTSVRPRMNVAVYRCQTCNSYEFQYIEGLTFTPLQDCEAPECKRSRCRGSLMLSIRDSRFCKTQQVTIQEIPSLVPPGDIPKQMKCIFSGTLSRVATPGLHVILSGTYVPLYKSEYRFGGGTNFAEPVLEVEHILIVTAVSEDESVSTKKVQRVLEETKSGTELYERLAASLAPTIHGHIDVKKALLLQLIGGSNSNSGLKIRGDIHMLLMGDPGIAKSQLLLRVCKVAPRAHFTCGKGASGVGLTASVVKDPVTGEFTLEGGAIVLSDNGVCCVDEFDKMEETDRTSIHEVMEQQTVSISKAGLVATLNARTTILAAANPVAGRYDITKPAVQNIGLPAALLSRFDIVFLLLDDINNSQQDLMMARHLLRMHREQKVSSIDVGGGTHYETLDDHTIRGVIRKCKELNPFLSPELASKVTEYYVQLRTEERLRGLELNENTYTTPRTLLALLRLSQALARLKFQEEIAESDFEEAVRLIKASKESISTRVKQSANQSIHKGVFAVKELLRSLSTDAAYNEGGWVRFDYAVSRANGLGVDAGDIEAVISTMVAEGTIQWDSVRKHKFKIVS